MNNSFFMCIKLILLIFMLTIASACTTYHMWISDTVITDFFDDKKIVELSKYIAKGDVSKAETLIASGVDINAKGENGVTLLLLALRAKKKSVYSRLLKMGASPNIQTKNGDSVMSYSAAISDSYYLEEALKYGGDPDNVNQENPVFPTPVYNAMAELNVNNVKLLIKAGANIDYSDFRGFTPVLYAANINQWEIVYFLLESGADFKKLDHWNKGIVYSLEENNIGTKGELYQWRKKVIQFLRQRGVSINLKIP